ncbi:MAG: hypothetical protein KIS66_01965 [Fimbriimonadaceae bacterium]|nr:hypothetical protein [Fimbriimonadaceae bacterium]
MMVIGSLFCLASLFAPVASSDGDGDQTFLYAARTFLARIGFNVGGSGDLRMERSSFVGKYVFIQNGAYHLSVRRRTCTVDGLTDRRKESAFLDSHEPRASFALTTPEEALIRVRGWRMRLGVPTGWMEGPVEHVLDRNPLYPEEKGVWGRSRGRYEEHPNGLPFLNKGNRALIYLDPGDGQLVHFSIRQDIEVQTTERRVPEDEARLTAIATYRADRHKIFESSDSPTPLTVRYGYGVSDAEAHPDYVGVVRARLGYEFVFDDTQKTTIIVDAESGEVLYRSYA